MHQNDIEDFLEGSRTEPAATTQLNPIDFAHLAQKSKIDSRKGMMSAEEQAIVESQYWFEALQLKQVRHELTGVGAVISNVFWEDHKVWDEVRIFFGQSIKLLNTRSFNWHQLTQCGIN